MNTKGKAKIRKCRHCGKGYAVPSPWPGYCSPECHKLKKGWVKKPMMAGSEFYSSREWFRLRYRAFKLYGRKCCLCGVQNTELHVDHVKPRSKFPELELKIDNLQILCRACNLGKGATDSICWRNQPDKVGETGVGG